MAEIEIRVNIPACILRDACKTQAGIMATIQKVVKMMMAEEATIIFTTEGHSGVDVSLGVSLSPVDTGDMEREYGIWAMESGLQVATAAAVWEELHQRWRARLCK
jgi:hypothetical protein